MDIEDLEEYLMLTEENKNTIKELVTNQGFSVTDINDGILIFNEKSSLFLNSWSTLEKLFVSSLMRNKDTYKVELDDGTEQSLKLGLLYGN